MAKVINGGDMFFEDDIKIIDAELECSLNLPQVPILLNDELQIVYNGHVFVSSKNQSDDKLIKIYTMIFGLQETDSPKAQEDRYFSDNSILINKLKEGFIEKVINGVSVLNGNFNKGHIDPHLGSELIDRISSRYSNIPKLPKQSPAGEGLIAKLEDGSVFNSEIEGCERVLLLDKKVYDLLTISEYVAKFEESFEASFYKKLQGACKSATPEDIFKLITDNKDKVHRKVLPKVRNKIWHSERSAKLYLDGAYWIPQFRGSNNDLVALYQKLLEKKLKIDATRSIK